MGHQLAFDDSWSVRSSSKVPSPGQRVIAIDAIVDVIFSFSTSRAIIALSRTCRAAHPIAASYFRVAYNPERFLQQFLPGPTDVSAFRSLQVETGVVVFGKAARNFLARAPLTDTEMNLSVDGSYAPQVEGFLTRAGYNVKTSEGELVFSQKREDEQVARKIMLRVEPPESFATLDLDKARTFPSEFTDVLTFDGAYSLFPAQDDETIGDPAALSEQPEPSPKSMYRSFSDRSSWVVTFDRTKLVLPHLALGMSTPARDPLYTSSSALVWPSQMWSSQTDDPKRRGTAIQRGIVLRSPLLRLTHIMCCPKLGQYVQQFLTRLLLAYPERAKSCFDTEVTQFLQIVFQRADIRDGLASYSAFWAVMKETVPLPSDTPGTGGLQWPHLACAASSSKKPC